MKIDLISDETEKCLKQILFFTKHPNMNLFLD